MGDQMDPFWISLPLVDPDVSRRLVVLEPIYIEIFGKIIGTQSSEND